MFDHPEYFPAWLSPIRDGDPDRLVQAAAEGKIKDMRKELALGASPNSTALILGRNTSALGAAVRSGAETAVTLLLEAGAHVNGVPEVERETPLLTGLLNLERDVGTGMAKLLLDAGADLDLGTDDGFTPLFVAAMLSNKEAAEMLAAAGGDPDRDDGPGGVTPSQIADAATLEAIKRGRCRAMVAEEALILDGCAAKAPEHPRRRL